MTDSKILPHEYGCPLAMPKNCKYNSNPKFCALVKADNICLKTASLQGIAKIKLGLKPKSNLS